MTTASDVLGQMAAAGLPELPEHLEVTGKIRRFGRKKRGWYRLFEHVGRRGRAYVTGVYGYWGLVDAQRVRPTESLDPADLQAVREQAAAQRRRDEERRAQLAARAAMRADERWRTASRTGRSRYLQRKAIVGESIRFEPDGAILVPMVRYDRPREQALVGLQAIAGNGKKRFGRGTAKAGAACRLGCVVVDAPILVAEGYATAGSLRLAVDYRLPVFVAFDAGNLAPIVDVLLELHPQCPILVCADDDHLTRQNPGRRYADQIRRRRGVHMIYPVWPGPRDPADTDFNDLHRSAGLHVVARQLRPALRFLGYSGALASEVAHAA